MKLFSMLLLSAILGSTLTASQAQLSPINCEPGLYGPLMLRGLRDTAPEFPSCLPSVSFCNSTPSRDIESGLEQQSSRLQNLLASVTTQTAQTVIDRFGQIPPKLCYTGILVSAGVGYVVLASHGYLPV